MRFPAFVCFKRFTPDSKPGANALGNAFAYLRFTTYDLRFQGIRARYARGYKAPLRWLGGGGRQVASLQRSVGGDELLTVAAGLVGKGHADGAGADERLKVALKGVLS